MPTEQFAIPICRHIKANGIRCQSPALSAEPFCFFHVRLHRDHPAPLTAQQIVDLWHEGAAEAMIGAGENPMQIARAYPRQNELNFPPLEDPDSIQLASSMLFHAVSRGKIHLRRARILRDLLRVANYSARRAEAIAADAALPSIPVTEIEQTPESVAVAPAATGTVEPAPATEPAQQLTSNQDFAFSPSGIKILQEAPPATLAN